MKKYLAVSIILFCAICTNSNAQTIIALYTDSIPNSRPAKDEERITYDRDSNLIIHQISRPTLTAYLPLDKKRHRTAVLICPGGGYWVTASKHEGSDIAIRFNEMGIAAFVLKYRIPDKRTMINTSIGPLQDAQRALQIIRNKSSEWNLDPNKIGIMGFSAGGHLAATVATHFDKAYIANPNKINLRPDFMVLVYALTSFMDSASNKGSRDKLLGENASPELVREFSNDLQVTSKTPPAFLVHAKDDPLKVENSLLFADALKKHGVPVEMYLYEKGGHGFGMYNKSSSVLWMDLVQSWLIRMNFVSK